VLTHVDLKDIKLHKTGDRHEGNLTVTSAVFDNNGNYVAGNERGVKLRLQNETPDEWMANGIRVPSTLDGKPGNYLVRLVRRDSEGQSMAARNGSVNIPQ